MADVEAARVCVASFEKAETGECAEGSLPVRND